MEPRRAEVAHAVATEPFDAAILQFRLPPMPDRVLTRWDFADTDEQPP
jgi:hypothetical protein